MRPIEIKQDKDENSAYQTIVWDVTKRCNFDCSYCDDWDTNTTEFAYSHSRNIKHPSFDKMIAIIDAVEDLGYYDIEWALTGGEPLVIPHINQVLKYMREGGPHSITCVTNGSMKLDRIIEAFGYLDHLILSFHYEFTYNRIDEYIGKCIALHKYAMDNNKRFTPRFMLYPGKFDVFKDIYDKLLAAGIKVPEFRNIQPLPNQRFIEGRNSYYNTEEDEMIEWFREQSNYVQDCILVYPDGTEKRSYPDEITFKEWNEFRGWTCKVGVDQLRLDPDGWVYRGECRAGGILGNVLDPEFEKPADSIICPFDKCLNYVDITMPKHA